MIENDKILIAKVISVHGIKGEVKIIAFCNNAEEIEKYPLFDQNNEKISLKISNKKAIKYSKNNDLLLIAKISGVDSRNKAEELRGYEIFANRQDFAKLSADEFYISDLLQAEIFVASQNVGKVVNADDYGAGAFLEIEFYDDFLQKYPQFEKIASLPFKNEYFGDFDAKNNKIEMFLPEIIEVENS